MQAPVMPDDEVERLAQLQALRILDSPIEARFDRITRLARRSFSVPIAAISLLDRERQWFKSITGLPLRETSRDASFCAHALLGERPLIVPDAEADPRFADNPLVVAPPHVRFYAGCPIRGPGGARVGTLCLLDHAPRSWNDEDDELLRDLAKLVEGELRLKRLGGAQDELLVELDREQLLAVIDPLTRLWNGAAIMEIARRELNGAWRDHRGCAMLAVDPDHFARLNEHHGRDVGDEVLRECAARLLTAIRKGDALGRRDGVGFVAVLPRVLRDEAVGVAERLRAALAQAPIVTACGPIALSLSVGVAWTGADEPLDVDGLLAAADAALRCAKRDGRDRVELA